MSHMGVLKENLKETLGSKMEEMKKNDIWAWKSLLMVVVCIMAIGPLFLNKTLIT